MKKVLLIIAQNGFQPKEYGEPKRVLSESGVEVVTASNSIGTAIAGYTNEEVEVDVAIDDVKANDYNGVFLIGGPGALEYLDNEIVQSIMKDAVNECEVYGAICISPRILAKSGVLSGKMATGWNDDGKLEKIFKSNNVQYEKKSVVQDGNVITAWGPDVAEEFGQEILKSLR